MSKKEATPIVNFVCTLIFLAFTFLYLFCFQDDLLIYAQHVLSGGITAYNPLIGAIIITLLLGLLSMVSAKFFANNLFFIPALYHLPSILVLASLTDVHVQSEDGSVFGRTWIVAILAFIVLAIVNLLVKGLPFRKSISIADILRELALNLGVLLAMIVFMTFMANTDEMDHLTLRQEVLISQGRYEEASLVGKKQVVGNRHMTTLRAFALAKTGEIGERLFEYRVEGASSADLFPTKQNPMMVLPEMKIYQFVGGVPAPGMDAKECIRLLNKRGQLRPNAHDYLYMSKLLDRDLDGFANVLANDSVDLKTLPKHYREALTMYNHLRTQPKVDYAAPEMDANFEDFMAIIKKNPNKVLQENALRDSYGKTYWFYYYLTASRAFTQSVSREN